MIRASRRWRPAAHRPPRFRRSVAALLLALAVLGSAAYVTVTVLQLITQLAVNAACDLMQLKINTAVRASMAQVRGEYYTYRTDADGTITAVSIDAERVGQVASLVLEHMMDGDDGQIELDIPLETLIGVNFLPGLKLPLVEAQDFRAAVETAYRLAQPGDTVTLSPACSSFDFFKNFAERGDTFRAIVESLQ